ncbi:MAG: hypothetical protein AB7P07_00010 [Hyphomonadaceae bacterium]
MLHDEAKFDARALPKGAAYVSAFAAALVIGLLGFWTYAATLTA